jgi:hypothetical protein
VSHQGRYKAGRYTSLTGDAAVRDAGGFLNYDPWDAVSTRRIEGQPRRMSTQDRVIHERTHGVYTYCAVAGDSAKIGMSRNHPMIRLAGFATGCPYKPHLLAWHLGGDRNYERRLHSRLPGRLNGEWFRITQALLDTVAEWHYLNQPLWDSLADNVEITDYAARR